MTEIRLLEPSEYRAATDMFAATLHSEPPTDGQWPRRERTYQHKRAFGAIDGGEVVGLARSVDSSIAVPGGEYVPMAAVTSVGVRSDYTRRGVATALKRAQLDEVAGRGVALAALHASEAVIYGRYGYGAATREATVEVNKHRARVHGDAPTDGSVALYRLEEAVERMPEIYLRCGCPRVGTIERPAQLWSNWGSHYDRAAGVMRLAEFRDGEGVTSGYAAYRVRNPWPDDGLSIMHVDDMVAATPSAFAGLWRYLIGVDLVDRIVAWARPVDEAVGVLLTDQRAAKITSVEDDLWLRLVDVAAALEARAYSSDGAVVVEVTDAFLPANDGRYRVSREGARRTDSAADLRMSVDTLAMAYLGAFRVSALVHAGRVGVLDQAAVEVADRLFATDDAPWCGTFF